MRIGAISDTHGQHNQVVIEKEYNLDVLIHAGDFEGHSWNALVDFLDWFENQPAKCKILIAGNHDTILDPNKVGSERVIEALEMMMDFNIIYLQDQDIIIDGKRFYGSPWTPDFFPERWAFNKPRGCVLQETWAKIPSDTNVLITHGPILGINDQVGNEYVGCEELAVRVGQLAHLELHVYGHIHEGQGVAWYHGFHSCNASFLDSKYRPYERQIDIFVI